MNRTSVVPARVREILLFLAIAFGLAWLVTLPLWLDRGLANPLTPILLIVMMFTPAVAALVVVRVTPGRPALERLGIRPLRPAKRTILLSVLGLFGAVLLVAASVAVAAALGLVELDLVTFSGFAEQIAAVVGDAPGASELPPIGLLVALQIAAIPVGGIVNGLFTIGEELGWRGYLLPALLERMAVWPTLLVSGAVWGLWHAPVILLGYNFGRTDATGVVLMVAACVLLGVLFGWLRLASGNVWPAVFAHGGFNAAGGLILLVIAAGEHPDLAVVGPLGFVAWAVMAVVIALVVAIPRLRVAATRPADSPG